MKRWDAVSLVQVRQNHTETWTTLLNTCVLSNCSMRSKQRSTQTNRMSASCPETDLLQGHDVAFVQVQLGWAQLVSQLADHLLVHHDLIVLGRKHSLCVRGKSRVSTTKAAAGPSIHQQWASWPKLKMFLLHMPLFVPTASGEGNMEESAQKCYFWALFCPFSSQRYQ